MLPCFTRCFTLPLWTIVAAWPTRWSGRSWSGSRWFSLATPSPSSVGWAPWRWPSASCSTPRPKSTTTTSCRSRNAIPSRWRLRRWLSTRCDDGCALDSKDSGSILSSSSCLGHQQLRLKQASEKMPRRLRCTRCDDCVLLRLVCVCVCVCCVCVCVLGVWGWLREEVC